jgi:hypothetical protein
MPSEEGVLREIYKEIGSLNAKMEDVIRIRETAEEANTTAREALISSRSAHKRIDKLESDKSWVSKLIIGAVIMAILGLVIITT